MKLVALMNVKNELGRYLPSVIEAMLEVVDEIRVQDDGSTDGTAEYLESLDRVYVKRNDGTRWIENEGQYISQGFAWGLEGDPTHMLAIDGDELLVGGEAIRPALEANPQSIAFTVNMLELWGLDPPMVRHDGGWRPHPVAILWRVPRARPLGSAWRMSSMVLAAPRSPHIVRSHHSHGRAVKLDVDVLHLGWAKPEEREARYARYAELDGGKYHAKAHLDSILWPDERCDLRPYDGPVALA